MTPDEEQRASALRALFEEGPLICAALSRAEIPLGRAERLVGDALLTWVAAGARRGQLHRHVQRAARDLQVHRNQSSNHTPRRKHTPAKPRLTIRNGRPLA